MAVTLALGAIIHDLAQATNIVTINAVYLSGRVTDPELLQALADLEAAALRLPALMERLRAL